MACIFISHASQDKDLAVEILEWFRSQGFQSDALFLDSDKDSGIRAGAKWEKEIYRAIERSSALVLILTPAWLKSRWCLVEFHQARALGKAIFPLVPRPFRETFIGDDIQKIFLGENREDGLERLRNALTNSALSVQDGFTFSTSRSPYPGLLAFEHEDAAVFFGRDDETRRLIELLRGSAIQGSYRLIALLGASGSGKSSLLRAGVRPRLMRAPSNWIAPEPFRPSANPTRLLARSLARALKTPDDVDALQSQLLANPASALTSVRERLRDRAVWPEAPILVSVDQGEELFSVTPQPERERFLGMIDALSADEGPFVTVLAMRSDFLDALQRTQRRFKEFSLGPMPLTRIRQIVEGPARVVGLTVEDGLAEEAARDAETDDALPLLAFALGELYKRRGSDGDMTLAGFQLLGDPKQGLSPLQNAVRKAADDVIARHCPDKAALLALREAFIPALVSVKDGDFVRRASPSAKLPSAARPLLEDLIEARLLSTREEGGDRVIEVSHEALLRNWPLLRDWLEEERDFLVWLERIKQARERFDAGDRDLLVGRELQIARTWLENRGRWIGETERDFIDRSTREEERRRAGALRRTRVFASVASVLALGATLTGGLAWRQAEIAHEREQLAREQLMRSMTSVGRLSLVSDPAGALQLSLAAFDVWPDKAPIDLLRAAVVKAPAWARIGPTDVEPPRMALTVPYISPNDVFGVDPEINHVLVREDPTSRSGAPGADIRLRRVPDGAELGRLHLDPLEFFLTPMDATTELFATRIHDTIKVYHLAPNGFGRPVARSDNVIDVAFTNGGYPIYFLSADGSIVTVPAPDAPPRKSVFSVRGAHTILARPDGTLIVLLTPGSIHPFSVEAGQYRSHPAIAIDSILAPPERRRQGLYQERAKVAWGPRPSQTLLASFADNRTEVRAVNLLTGRVTAIHESRFSEHGLNRWVFTANLDATRFSVTEGQGGDIITRVVDVAWSGADDEVVARAMLTPAGELKGREVADENAPSSTRGYKTSFPIAAQFAPNGSFLVIAHYLKSRDTRGTAVNGVGVLESFDISQITRTEPERFQTCDAIHFSDGGYASSVVLQPQAIFDIGAVDPERLGTAPLVRLAYSRNSRRVAALDTRGVYHIFRVRDSHGFNRAPEGWAQRLCAPTIQVHGRLGRFVDVTYGDGVRTIYDLHAETAVSPRQFGEPIVGVASATRDTLLLVGARGSALLKQGSVTSVASFPLEVKRIISGDGVVLAHGLLGALIIDQSSGRLIGQLDGPNKLEFLRQLNGIDRNNPSHLSLARPRIAVDSVITVATEDEGIVRVWQLKPSADEAYLPELALTDIPIRNIQGNDWLSVRRLTASETLWVNEGIYSGATTVRQFDLKSGREIARYAPPVPGWPADTFEIEVATQVGKDALVLVRDYRGDGRGGYMVGRWPIDGGPCLSWIDLGKLEDNPIYLEIEPDPPQARALFWVDRRSNRATFIDLLNGERLWQGVVDGENPLPPQMVSRRGVWGPSLGGFYESASLDVMMRGRDYWQDITTIPLPENQRKRIEFILGGAPASGRQYD